MRKIIVVLITLAALAVPAGAAALTPRQTADQHAALHCISLSCDTWYFLRSEYVPANPDAHLPAGTAFVYYLHWWGYGFSCKFGPAEPRVYVYNDGSVVESGWGPDNTWCS